MSEENKSVEEFTAQEPIVEETADDSVSTQDSVVQEVTSDSNPEKNPTDQKKMNLSITNILILCIALASFALLAVLYIRTFPPAVKPQETPSETASSEPTATPLPTELTDLDSVTILVNKSHPLPADYVPKNLVTPYLNSSSDVIQVDQKAEKALRSMLKAASKKKLNLILNAGYISYETQNDYYEDRVSLVGQAEANKLIPVAGCSEHQTGLGFDFTNSEEVNLNSISFGVTDEGKWLYDNAYKYGFILRYPEGKEDITGYEYQPWHYRYVGEDVAKAMYEIDPNLTMEEYFGVDG